MTRVADSYSFGYRLRRHIDDIDFKARQLGWGVDILRNTARDRGGISDHDITLAESRYRRYVAASARLWTYAAKRAGVPECCYIRHGDCGRHKPTQ